MSDQHTDSIKPPSIRNAIFAALSLVVLDAFVLNQGAIAFFVGLWQLLIRLPKTAFSKKYAAARIQKYRVIAIYLTAVAVVFALNFVNNRLAQDRFENLVAVIKTFYSENQRYPKDLEELVPNYIDQVPVAKYTFSSGEFGYANNKNNPILFYEKVPPFGRPTYFFARDKRVYMD